MHPAPAGTQAEGAAVSALAERERLYRHLGSQQRQRERAQRLGHRERIAELWASTDELLDRLLELRGGDR